MIIDCQTNLTGRLSAIELAEFNESVGKADAFFLLAAPELAVQDDVNDVLADFLEKTPKAMGFATFNPLLYDQPINAAKELISIRRMKGFALYCPHNKMHPMHSKVLGFYEWAQEARVPIFFYNSNNLPPEAAMEFAMPYLIDEVARTFPKLKIIIGNSGKPFIHQTIAVLTKNSNVYATLAINPSKMWSVYNILVGAAESDALDKFLFCSNYPDSSMDECMESLLGFNRSIADTKLPLVPLDKVRNIINRNSMDLLHIN